MYYSQQKLQPIPFTHLPHDIDITSETAVKSLFGSLATRVFASPEDIKAALIVWSELNKAIADELSWRYVKMSQHADDPSLETAYNDYYAKVIAANEDLQAQFRRIVCESPFAKDLDEYEFGHLVHIFKNQIELFREENIPLMIEESELACRYAAIVSKMSVMFDGKERTPAQLAVYLKDADREKREAAFRARYQLFMDNAPELDQLYDDLLKKRHQIALNAGFSNYRDFKHQEMGRFAYTPQDLYTFHEAVKAEVIPFCAELNEQRRKTLKLDNLRPWDTAVDLDGRNLKPFETTDEFIHKAIDVLDKVYPPYAEQLAMMNNSGMLDLENRKGKAPGGYNTSIHNLASSFIFMNHVMQHKDVVTLLHESGHAMHGAATKDIHYYPYLETPSEVAELASMSMELLTMDYWDIYYSNKEDLKKAKREQLEGTLTFLPWCMTVDALQHWIYLNPQHNAKERDDAYVNIAEPYRAGVDFSGLEHMRRHGWKMQLHIYEVPFYYIEYGMAQLGALSIYKNYRENKARALQQYQDFLKLGYSRPVNEIYQTAGIDFNFSQEHIRDLVSFVRQELADLDKE
jgi:oligoendopeptidase F